jgi:hypothetical protein
VRRSELAHILRAACDVTQDPRILVIGSQAILASFDEDALPQEATLSIEADIAFLDDPGERKSDLVDGAIGELSPFHDEFGIYGQGVSLSTATLPAGWEKRLASFDDPEAGESKAVCLEPHDLVVSKLVAGREKDFRFARALLDARLIRAEVLSERAKLLPGPGAVRGRVLGWIDAAAKRASSGRS